MEERQIYGEIQISRRIERLTCKERVRQLTRWCKKQTNIATLKGVMPECVGEPSGKPRLRFSEKNSQNSGKM